VSSRGVRLIRPDQCTDGPATPGMDRKEAVSTDGMWVGLMRAAPGSASGWHHHGEYESTIYILSGTFRMEFGPSGAEQAEAGPGDFLFVEPRAIHRELNPGSEDLEAIVMRAGHGEPLFNVDGPELA
jgi:uncharacterized RmlC-like cupin family protein